jgi:hypothetical protein
MSTRPVLQHETTVAASDAYAFFTTAIPIDAAFATDDEHLPIVDLTETGFTLRTPALMGSQRLVHMRFTVGACLSIVLPARVVQSLRPDAPIDEDHLTQFEFAFDQGSDDLERIVALLLEAARDEETVH